MEESSVKLFTLIKEFYKEKFWEDYWDTDILAIQLPEREEPIFVSILGSLEEEFGVLVYRDLKELAYLFESIALSDESDPFRLLLLQNCLAVNYEDRENLEKEEYDMVKASGVPFRGRKAWPVLTEYKTGYYPAEPSTEDLLWLSDVMEKIIETAKAFRSKTDFYENEDYDFQFLMREYDEDGTFEDGLFDVPEEILQGLSPDIIGRQPILLSTFEVMRAKQTPVKNHTWEMDLEQVEIPVTMEEEDDERPFFPSILAMVDPAGQSIVYMDVVTEENIEELQRKVLQAFLSENSRPVEVLVPMEKEPQITAYFWELFHELGIRMTVADHLPAISSIKMQLSDLPDEFT